MNLGLVCPEMAGHLNPSLALGRELGRRGHRVRVITTPGGAERITAAGLEHLVIGRRELQEGQIEKAADRLGRLRGYAGLLFTTRLIVDASRLLIRELPALLEEDPCEALLIDQVNPGAAVVAERHGLPYLTLCNALAVTLDPASPPAVSPWRYSLGAIARVRNRLAIATGQVVIDTITGARRDGVSAFKLCRANDAAPAMLSQQPPGFDFPAAAPAPRLHYTGPWHEAIRDEAIPFPWERLDGRPLIYASLGTIQNRPRRFFRAIIQAVRARPVQLVLSLGRREAVWDEALPENVIAVPFAPQLALLPRASLAITHAGLNTALECLAAGVPMLALPITNDQPGVARRVEWVGAGRMLPPRFATAGRLGRLIGEVMERPRYREVAQRFQREIARAPGAVLAADLVEGVLAGEGESLAAS